MFAGPLILPVSSEHPLPATSAPIKRPPSSAPSATHIPALDGLRGIAVLLVMLLHFSMMTPNGPLDSAFSLTFDTGWLGVDLFFVLSGFLITGILFDAKGGAFFFRNFYLRRSLRIFPLYYAFLCGVLLVLPWLAPGSMERLDGQGWLWSYLSNFLFVRVGWEGMPEHTIHLWSLAIEEQFYLLWPLVVFLFDRKNLIRVALIAIAGAIVFRAVAFFIWPNGIAGYALLPARVDSLAMGGLLALVIRGPEGKSEVSQLARRLLLPGLGLLAAAVGWSMVFSPQEGLLPPLKLHTQLLGYTGMMLLSGALILLAVAESGSERLRNALTWKPLMALGKYSYGLYMIHVPVRDVIRMWRHNVPLPRVLGSQLPAQIGIFILGMGVSVLLALLSWNLFEKHFLKLKDYFPYNAPSKRERTEARPKPAEPARTAQFATDPN